MQQDKIAKKQKYKCYNKNELKFLCPRWQLSNGLFNEAGYFIDKDDLVAFCPECYIVKNKKKELSIVDDDNNIDEDYYDPKQTKNERKKLQRKIKHYTKQYINKTNNGSKLSMVRDTI